MTLLSLQEWLAGAGVLGGLTLYTYLAARAFPLFFAGYLIYLLIWHRPMLKNKGFGLLLFFLLFAVVAFPLFNFLRLNPGAGNTGWGGASAT